MIITKTVMVAWNPSNMEWYRNKGYTFTKWFDEFEVTVNDLALTSSYLLEFQCDYCTEKFSKSYGDHIKTLKNDKTGKHACSKCRLLRKAENNKIIEVGHIELFKESTYNTYYKVNISDISKSIFIKPCKKCRRFKELECFRSSNVDNKFIEHISVCRECEKDYKEEYNIVFKLRYIKATSVKMNLPIPMTEKQLEKVFERFDEKCALTKSIDIVCEHFIPVSWGHGGTYEGNIYLLNNSLNLSKGTNNPFSWIKKKDVKNKISMSRWDKLIKYLSAKNKLTVPEFREFVHWCENNKRTPEEVKRDGNKTSIDLWRESKII
jgi:hypothetical protein